MNSTPSILCGALLALLAAVLPLSANEPRSLDDALNLARTRSAETAATLAETAARIEAERVPLATKLATLEDELAEARKEFERVVRVRDGRSLDLTNLQTRAKNLTEQEKYVSGLIDDYIRNAEARLHIAEAQRHGEALAALKSAAENGNLAPKDRLAARLDLIDLSLTRLESGTGGDLYAGSAADADGRIRDGKFLQLGPLVWFASDDKALVGPSDSRLGSAEPSVLPLPDLDEAAAATLADAILSGTGELPLDPTQGQAIKLALARDTIADEVRKGGAVMIPMGILAGISLLIAIIKWIQFTFISRPGAGRLRKIFTALASGDTSEALRLSKGVRGPIGALLVTAINHLGEPEDLVEEALYEATLKAKTNLNSYLPFIGITAAAAPLLGLLGTVTGMISTFKLITIFGTGDAGNFSAGISEALITTKWGLILAIPSLLIHAFLTRKARAVLDDMEKTSLAYLSHINKDGSIVRRSNEVGGPPPAAPAPPADPGPDIAPAGA